MEWQKIIWYEIVCLRLAGFYGIFTIVSFLMPNLVYTYIENKYDLLTHFVNNIS